jgi:integrase
VLSKAESKGKKSQRVIHLDNTAAEICRRHAAKYPLGPLFRTLHGTPWTTKLLSNRCVRIAKKVGFRFSPYSMRHTFATEAIIKGVDLQTTATLMGHKGLTMLNRVYAHVQQRQDHLRDSLKRITE